ncbi:MAG: DUF58 domain-containing protein [Actinomycetota bacterium]|nr:DUF58 domain-containing protein [Actinomycetota bacterium]
MRGLRAPSRAAGAGALGAVLVLAGAVFDSASLYPPGVALILLAVGAVVWVRLAARSAAVERAPGPASVVEEQPWPLRLRVSSPILPPPGGELLEPLLGCPMPIGGRRSQRVRIDVRFSRRGRRGLAAPELVIRDPLGLCERRVTGAGGEDVLVLPRVESVSATGGGGRSEAALLSGHGGRPAAGRLPGGEAELDLDGLRPYRPGASSSRIHWPALARTGEMLERRLVAESESSPLVVLDARRPASDEALDAAVRAAASLTVHLARVGGVAVLLPGDRRTTQVVSDLAAWPAVHARLAVVEAGSGAPTLGRAPRSGTVFWVTAADLVRSPAALSRAPVGGRTLVTPRPLPTLPVTFTVAGCSGQPIGRPARPGRRAERAAA